MGRHSNPDIVSKLQGILAGQERERPPARTTRSLQRHRRLTLEERDELLTQYETGVPIEQLAGMFKIHRTTVLALVRRAGAEQRYRIIDRNLDEARKLYESGWSTARIGEHFDVDAATVWRTFRGVGDPMRKPWERP